MAPLTYSSDSLERADKLIATRSASSTSLSLGETVGIAIGIGLVCSFALVALVYFFLVRRRQPRMTPRVRSRETWNAMETGVYRTSASAAPPRKGFGRVLSVFTSKRRQPMSASHNPPAHDYLPQDEAARPRQFPDKESVELQGGYVEDRRAFLGTESAPHMSPFRDTRRQSDGHGSHVSLYNPAAVESEHVVESSGPYRPESDNAPSSIQSLDLDNMVINTEPPKIAAWHRKRTGAPPPLTIEPPEMHSRSPLDAYSAYSTYATTHSAFTYGSINIPEVPPLPSQTPNDHQHHHDGTRYPYDGSQSSMASPFSQQHFPPSPQSPGSIPSMSRSDSGAAAQETFPLPPPTPTYSTSHQRIPDDANFECLGPLPPNIPLPSPPHFRTAFQPQPQPQHQQHDPFLTAGERGTPGNHSPNTTDANSSTASLPHTTTTNTNDATRLAAFAQDPLLHATSPFRPHHHSPVVSTFAHSSNTSSSSDLHTAADAFFPASSRRRNSTDSLGSNFTVEEEARIQAQIVKNLAALDKERVKGEGDIVHIPQVSARRYSWEE